MRNYKWIITQDFLDGNTQRSAVGVSGPRGCDNRTADQLPDTFRIYDGDGELYYEGKTDALSNTASGEDCGFEPLDDFGMPDSGCTEIRYLNDKGEWETL